jgi:hypothetical protein
MNEDQSKIDMDLLRKHAALLSEHFDSVQIFVTRFEDSDIGTVNAHFGSGNWFTRFGQVHNWLIKETERSRAELRQNEE